MTRYSVNGILFEVPDEVKYFKFLTSNNNSYRIVKDLIIFEFISGVTAEEYVTSLGEFESVYPENVLVRYPTSTKIVINYMNINRDNEFLKVCHEDINLTQLRYRIPELRMRNFPYNLTILLGTESTFDLDDYYNLLESTKLLIPVNRVDSLSELGNVEIHNSRVHNIKSSRVYLPLSKYQQYRISALDYITDFITKMSGIFEDYGFQLVEYNKRLDTDSDNIVTFRINTHTKEFLHRINVRIPEHDIMWSGSRISFNLTTPDTSIYEDFKMRYNNIDIIQNIREFSCKDKYDADWRYDCVWTSQLDDSFSHDFPNNDLGTYGYSFQFTATLEFFDVYDRNYSIIRELLVGLNIKSDKGSDMTEEIEINNYVD